MGDPDERGDWRGEAQEEGEFYGEDEEYWEEGDEDDDACDAELLPRALPVEGEPNFEAARGHTLTAFLIPSFSCCALAASTDADVSDCSPGPADGRH